ncbi:type III pantothenate kinase [Methylacidiphilum caldifontis]|uniref:Type III pantothenate kinase n=1 Tax=Methylacidiphilum caldifontis TaxID=2795386 RepID=A0A4Y8PGH2_9BACT|nr:type III pantothenate kinase [Methylacidiphilum caldifontis]QSR88475.1 type III pantothenate kinase [Methylacidiphilum caldifontis]TFE71303.1 type III pantothenate kinase [Methylacidiphilum caldifontis]
MILVDVSNTVTKIGLFEDGKISLLDKIPTSQIGFDFTERVAQKFPLEDLILCSVVPKNDLYFEWPFRGRIYKIDPSVPLGIPIDYPNPAEIGADRLSNAVALAFLYGYPAVAIDFGTATTFDIVDQKGAFCGGIIAPGLNMMTTYLHEKTALLPLVDLKEPLRIIAHSTEEAVRVGAVHGYRGMVKYLLEKIKEELGFPQKFIVVATGGQCRLVCSQLGSVEYIDELLTLKGIRLIGENLIKIQKKTPLLI